MAKDPLDDMLDDLDNMDMGMESDPPKNKREAVTRAATDAGSSFKDAFKNNPLERVGNVVDGAMPKGISKEVDEAVNAKNLISDLYIKNSKDLKSSAKKTTELIKSKIPETGPLRGLVNKVDTMLKSDDDDLPTTREPTEDEKIMSKLGEIFNKENKRSRVEAIIQQTSDDNKFAQTTDMYTKILTEMKLSNDFSNSQTMSYYRKSLELKFKSVYIAKQQLEVTKSGFDMFKNQLESIVSNTGLPDLIKLKKREQLGESINNRMREDMTDLLYSNANPLTGLRDKLVKKVEGGMLKAKESLDTVNDTGDMLGSMGEGPSMGTMAGGYLAGMASTKAGKYLNELANKNAGFRDKMFNFKMKSSNLKDTLEESADDQLNKNTTMSRLASKVLRTMGGMVDGDKNTNKTITTEDPNESSSFDVRTKNSINIIPELLSRIYGEVNAIRKHSPEVTEALYFNHKTGRLEDKGSIGTSIKDTLGKKVANYAGNEVSKFTDELSDKGGVNLTGEEKNLLNKAIIGEGVRNTGMTLKSLSKKEFLDKLPKELRMKTKKNLVRAAKAAKEDISLIDDFNDRLNSMKMNLPMVDRLIEEYFKSGQVDVLLSTGLIIPKEDGSYIINEEKYIELVQSGIDGAKDDIPEEPKDPVSEELDNIKKNIADKFNNSKLKKEAKKLDKLFKNKIVKPISSNGRDTIKNMSGKASDKLGEMSNVLDKIQNQQATDNKVLDDAIATMTGLKTKIPTMSDVQGKLPTIPTGAISTGNQWLSSLKNTNLPTIDANGLYNQGKGYGKEQVDKLKNINPMDKVEELKNKNPDVIKLGNDIMVNAKLVGSNAKDLARFAEGNILDKYGDSLDKGKSIVTDTIKSGKSEGIKLLDTLENRMNNTLTVEDILKKKDVAVEELHSVYESSISAAKGTDFLSWANNLGLEFDGSKFKKSKISEEFLSIKDTVKAKLVSQLDDLVFEEKDGSQPKGGKKSKLDYLSAILKKTRALDKKIFFSLPKLILGGLTGLWKMGKGALGFGKDFMLGSGKDFLSTMITGNAPKTAKDKDSAKRSSSKVGDIFNGIREGLFGLQPKKSKYNDKDGDGDRDGSWQDRFQQMKNKRSKKDEDSSKGKSKKDTNKDKDSILSGILGMLTNALPMLGGLVTGLGTLGGVIKSIGGSVIKNAMKAGATALGVGSTASTAGAAAAASGLKGKNKTKNAKATNSKIMNTLKTFKTKILKKFGKSAGGRIVIGLMKAIGKRLVPVVGLAVLAYDAVMVGKYMLDGLDFKSALSKQVIGFDLFNPHEAGVDESGEPVEPDDVKTNEPSMVSGLNNEKDDENDSTGKGIFESVGEKLSNFFSFNKNKQPGKFIDKSSNFFKTGSFKSTPKKEEIFKILDIASSRTGVDSNILKAFAGIESSFNPNAKAGTSSAKGLFQFIDGTWGNMIKKYGGKYDLDRSTSPYDPMASALMGAEYIKENTKILKSVKDDVGITDLYLGHFLGAGGAKKLLSADANEIAAGILPASAKSNRSIFFNRNGTPKTVSEVYNTLDTRLVKKAKNFGFQPASMEEAVKSTAVNASRESFLDNAKRVASTNRKIMIDGKELTGESKTQYLKEEADAEAKEDKEFDSIKTPTTKTKPTRIFHNGVELTGKAKEDYIANRAFKRSLRDKERKDRLLRRQAAINGSRPLNDTPKGVVNEETGKPNTVPALEQAIVNKVKPTITDTSIDYRPGLNKLGAVLEESLAEHVKSNEKLDTIVTELRTNRESLTDVLGKLPTGETPTISDPTEEKGITGKPVIDLRKKRYEAS